MSAQSPILVSHEACAVCGGKGLEVALELPDLPLTDTFCKIRIPPPYGPFSQDLLFCSECAHAQLRNIVAPEILYGERYHFRTSMSATARSGATFFLNFLKRLLPGKTYSTILDIGCNDLYLLEKLKPLAKRLIGIDPIWAGKEETVSDPALQVIGCGIEAFDTDQLSVFSPDLVICRHTIEHIAIPRRVLQTLLNFAKDDAVFLFEFPALEPLVAGQRFDHVFHQHLQYFSLCSFARLVETCGGQYLLHLWNYQDWGALLFAFTKKGWSSPQNFQRKLDTATIKRNYKLFQSQFSCAGEVLDSFKETNIYGYGAAQMLPVISYHLKNDLSILQSILDDDPEKDGLYYWNLPVTVRHPDKVGNIARSAVFITALDNMKPILNRLYELSPRHIIYPLHVF